MDKLNLSLDEIQAKRREEAKAARAAKAQQQQPKAAAGDKKKASANGGAGAKKGAAAAAATPQKEQTHAKGAAAPPLHTGTPVIVSQLNAHVDQTDLSEIFSRVGVLKSVEMLPARGDNHAARLTFKLRADAEKAVREYDGRELDGRRMRLTIAGANSGTKAPPAASPRTPGANKRPAAGGGAAAAGGGGHDAKKQKQ